MKIQFNRYPNLYGVFFSILGWALAGSVWMFFRFYGTGFDSTYVDSYASLILIIVVSSIWVGGISFLASKALDKIKGFREQKYVVTIVTRTVLIITIGISNVVLVALVTAIRTNIPFLEEIQRLFTSDVLMKFLLFMAYASFLYNIIIQFSRMFGTTLAIEVITGYYHQPRQGYFIFAFLDLNDFSTITEEIGNTNVAMLLNDCFTLISNAVGKHQGSVYSYAGDAAIVFWDKRKGLKNNNYLKAITEFFDRLKRNEDYFLRKYRVVPQFKVGVDLGPAIGFEVGTEKKEVSYLGDVLNTASRLLSIQKHLHLAPKRYKIFLSQYLYFDKNRPPIPDNFGVVSLGKQILKGKVKPVEVFVLEEKIFQEQMVPVAQ